MMRKQLKKFVLTAHITFSVGWLGAVAVFMVLAITGLTTIDNQLARGALLAMKLSGWYIIVPFCLASLLTGLLQAIATKWGLFKHYWIVVKLFLTIVITILLLLHMQPITYLAALATAPSFSNAQYATQLIDISAKAGASILVLVAITTISVYKPWGRILPAQKGFNPLNTQASIGQQKKPWTIYALAGFALLILYIIIRHLFGGGMQGH